jgi:hypothetical protein
MIGQVKIDIVNSAYSLLRISGITTQPSGDDITLALNRLEELVHEYQGRNMLLSWNFEETPKANTRHGLPMKYVKPMASSLAMAIITDFGIKPHPALTAQYRSGCSFMQADSAKELIRETQYPARQAIGSGVNLRYNRYQRFYRPEPMAPIDAETTSLMFVGDVDDFYENFKDWLYDNEDILTFTVEADTGLEIISSSEADSVVTFRVQAVGRGQGRGDMAIAVRIRVETSRDRVQTRVQEFEVREVPDRA